MLELIQIHPGIGASELAERLDVDSRTIRRYVRKLEDYGIPVVSRTGRYGGYRLSPSYKLPPLNFTREEGAVIILGLAGSSFLSSEETRTHASSALAKINRVIPEETREELKNAPVSAYSGLHGPIETPSLARLLNLSRAVDERLPVTMKYGNTIEPQERTVEPLLIKEKDGRWYLIAYCRLRQDYRLFRIDRIESLKFGRKSFSLHESFNAHNYFEAQLKNFPSARTFELVFFETIETMKRIIPERYGTLLEDHEGNVLFKGSASDLNAAGRYIISLNIPFRVIGPSELKKIFRQIGEELLLIAES